MWQTIHDFIIGLNVPYLEVFYNLGSILVILSMATRSIVWLRIIFALACIIFATFGYMSKIYSMFVWNLAYIVMNSYQLMCLYIDQKPLMLPKAAKEVFTKDFAGYMTSRTFLWLWKKGVIKTIQDEYLLRCGDINDCLIVIIDGEVIFEHEGEFVAKQGKTFFIGSMHFFTGEPMSFDIRAKGKVEFIVWKNALIKQLKEKYPDIYASLTTVIGVDLVRKVREFNLKLSIED